MKPSNKAKRKIDRAGAKLQQAAVTAFAIGVMFLLLPLFAKSSKVLAGLSTGLGSIAWWFIAIGVVLFGFTLLIQKTTSKSKVDDKEKQSSFIKASASEIKFPAKLISEIPKADIPKPSTTWNKQVFTDIEWRRFEAVCERFFAQGGFKTKSQSHGADGGVDIWMYSDNAESTVSIAQCKHFNNKDVDVKLVREFYGVMSSHKLQRGTFVTSSGFTADAQKFANANGINALDGDKFLKLIATRTPLQQKELLDIAYEGEYSIPTCASCGIKLVKRTKFWGCSNFPRCRTQIYFKAA